MSEDQMDEDTCGNNLSVSRDTYPEKSLVGLHTLNVKQIFRRTPDEVSPRDRPKRPVDDVTSLFVLDREAARRASGS